jgi:hypothetical protein
MRDVAGELERSGAPHGSRDAGPIDGPEADERLAVEPDESGHRDDVPFVVVDHGDQGRIVSGAQEMCVARTDLASRDVRCAFETEDLRLHAAKVQLVDPVPVDPARDVDEIEMRQDRKRGTAREHEPRRDQRQVERLAIVGHQHRRIGDAPGESIEHGRFLAELTQEELLDDEGPCRGVEPGEPDEKRDRARAGRETRRFGVEVERARRVSVDQRRVEREQREHRRRRLPAHMHRRSSYPVRGTEPFRSNV